VTTVETDALAFLASLPREFDVVSHVSMLHHIPEYLDLLAASTQSVAHGGVLMTFQDPLRYDRLPRGHYSIAQGLYMPWRLTQGDVIKGIGSRHRRRRGKYLADNQADQVEYHVVRNGLDSDEMLGRLRDGFAEVRIEIYFSSQARLAQRIGERLRIRSTFGILATDRL
jgi:hypothetical protein